MPWFYIQTSYGDNSLFTFKQKIILAIVLNVLSLSILVPVLYGILSNFSFLEEKTEQYKLLGVMAAFFVGVIIPAIAMSLKEKRKT